MTSFSEKLGTSRGRVVYCLAFSTESLVCETDLWHANRQCAGMAAYRMPPAELAAQKVRTSRGSFPRVEFRPGPSPAFSRSWPFLPPPRVLRMTELRPPVTQEFM